MVEYFPNSAKDQSRLQQFDAKVYQEYSSDMHWLRGESGMETLLLADLEEMENLDASEIHPRKLSAKGRNHDDKWVNISYSESQMEQQNCLEETTVKPVKNYPGNHCTSELHRFWDEWHCWEGGTQN